MLMLSASPSNAIRGGFFTIYLACIISELEEYQVSLPSVQHCQYGALEATHSPELTELEEYQVGPPCLTFHCLTSRRIR